MGLILGITGLIVALLVIYFNVPYSGLKSEFKKFLAKSEENTKANEKDHKYKINDLPKCMQNFYNYTGLMDKADSRHVSFDFKNADLVNDGTNKTLKVDYSEHIFADVPARFAFIDSSVLGIPFQGLDSFIEGKGGMKGVVAKNYTLFNQRGYDMDKSTLVTWLAEIILMPSQLLNGDVEIKELDKNTALVSIKYADLAVSGVYKFKDNGELFEFITNDRGLSHNEGKMEYKKWSALFEEYTRYGKLLLPGRLKAEWHFENSDLVYFDGSNVEYTFH